MNLTKIGPKRQVTIPKDVFERLQLAVGDYLDVRVKGSGIILMPQRVIPRDEEWFHTPEWQAKEREADEAIARGEVSGPYASAQAAIRHLRERPMPKKQ
jgi:AbrB family looped-hinge helix DNA binding protein